MIDSIQHAIIGGAMIGLAASWLLFSHGRVAGISGIVGGLLGKPNADSTWRMTFIAGLFAAGGILMFTMPTALAAPDGRSLGAVAAAGLCVGIGVRMSRGCTSGHGVCGITRFSTRSVVATLCFMATGFATATGIRFFFGGSL